MLSVHYGRAGSVVDECCCRLIHLVNYSFSRQSLNMSANDLKLGEGGHRNSSTQLMDASDEMVFLFPRFYFWRVWQGRHDPEPRWPLGRFPRSSTGEPKSYAI
ncbi:hypothetical protein J6590_095795 [Homalodisca vitripennis]|nr:hypothetical protein J6590_067353 [Homalodisca vitripennis]KAG8255311.1 hypothetical protein J6590_095795 [Homalodisca vitripennis]